MNLKEAVEALEEYGFTVSGFPQVEQALETVLAAIRRANLTDEEIKAKATALYDVDDIMFVEDFEKGARHVRDLLHGEGKG